MLLFGICSILTLGYRVLRPCMYFIHNTHEKFELILLNISDKMSDKVLLVNIIGQITSRFSIYTYNFFSPMKKFNSKLQG